MRILQLLPRLMSGGLERFTVDLANELSKKHEVYIYTLKGQTKENIYLPFVDSRVKVGYLDLRKWTDPAIFFRLRKCIECLKPDIIHVHGRSFHYIAPLKILFPKLKIIQTIHSNGAASEYRSFEISLFRYFYSTGKIIPVLISKEQKKNFRQLYPKASPFIEINNGRSRPDKSPHFEHALKEIEGFKKDANTKIFLNIARLSPQKNHYMLIRAFNKLKAEGANAVLVIIGRAVTTHEESEKIHQFVLNEVDDNVKWIGEKANATDYLYCADYFCLSSFWEGLPISLLEALSVGCVPVCTPVGEIPVMLKRGQDGFLSEEIEENSYFRELLRAYNTSENVYLKMRNNVKQLYDDKFSMEQCAKNYLFYYQKLLSDGKLR